MRERQIRSGRERATGQAILWGLLALALATPVRGQAVDPATGEARRPDTIHELTRALAFTFENLLEPEEYELLQTKGPEEIREIAPDLYEQISQNVVRWTDEWVAAIDETLDTVSLRRLEVAVEASRQVDELLRGIFEERDWPYKELQVVLLPERVFHDSRRRYSDTGGMYIPFYPDAYFATLSRDWPVEHVLIHESIHHNQHPVNFGHVLTEGITDTAARHLVLEHGLSTSTILCRKNTYPDERSRIDEIIEAMTARAGLDRAAAIDVLLAFYVTGDETRMNEILGVPAWKRIRELSLASRQPLKKDVRKALALGGGKD